MMMIRERLIDWVCAVKDAYDESVAIPIKWTGLT